VEQNTVYLSILIAVFVFGSIFIFDTKNLWQTEKLKNGAPLLMNSDSQFLHRRQSHHSRIFQLMVRRRAVAAILLWKFEHGKRKSIQDNQSGSAVVD